MGSGIAAEFLKCIFGTLMTTKQQPPSFTFKRRRVISTPSISKRGLGVSPLFSGTLLKAYHWVGSGFLTRETHLSVF